jgi:N12 class adenine-specific DNA methylase
MQSQKMLMEMDNRVHSMHERLEMAEAAFTRQIEDMGHSITSITEHIDIPRAFMEELGTLEQQLQCITDEFETLSAHTLKEEHRKFEQALARERSNMQEKIEALSARNDESQHALGAVKACTAARALTVALQH